jgi:hypothetical protein
MAQKKVSPSADNLMQGGSRLFVTFSGDSHPYHFGLVQELGATPEFEEKETFSGMGGSKVVYKRRKTLTKITHPFKALERTNRVVRAWMQGGAAATAAQTGGTNITQTIADITGAVTGAAVVVGVYYALDNHSITANDGITGTGTWVEGTDYKIDYVKGAIAFLRALVDADLDDVLQYDAAVVAASATESFPKFAVLDQEVSAEIWNVLEDGKVIEKSTIPKARLEPSGTGAVSFEEESALEFNLVQLKHDTLGWGTFTTLDKG